MQKRKHALALLFLTLIYGTAQAVPICQTGSGNTLPVYFVDKLVPFIMAGIDGNPAVMLLDTGASFSTITPALANQANLTLRPLPDGIEIDGIGGNSVPAQLTTVDQLILGSAAGSGMTIGVLSMVNPNLPANDALNAVDGTVGTDILKNYDIDMDFPDRQVTLFLSGSCLPVWTANATPISFSPDAAGGIHFWLKIEGKRYQALLDSGSAHSSMPRPLFISSGLGLDAGKPIKTVQTMVAGGFVIKDQIYQLNQSEIGGQQTGDMMLEVSMGASQAELQALNSTFAQYGNGNNSDTEQMILGEPYIRTHRIFISYADDTLYMAAAAKP